MTAGHFCNREVVITDQQSTIVEAAQLMRRHHVGDVVVIEERDDVTRPVGIITDRDIVVELIAEEVDLKAVTVGDVMSYDLVTITEQNSIWDTLTQMRRQGIRRLPVVNDQGGLEGILTMDDILVLLTDELNQLAKVPDHSQKKEQVLRE